MSDPRLKPAIGVIFHPRFPPETLADYARRAEAAGFAELWLWDDCFLPGAFTAVSIALSTTQQIKVGIGLLPVPAYHPLFAAMEITTLARAFPGRILPGFGHGVERWMTQIGAAQKSPLKTLHETVTAVRQLLSGESVTTHGVWVNLDQVQMQLLPGSVPPLYVGAVREKTLRLAGRVGEGTILTSLSSPAYIRWASSHIQAGMAETGRPHHRVVVFLDVKVNPDRELARAAVRRALAARFPWKDAQMEALGIASEVASFFQTYPDLDEAAQNMPDEWVDAFSATGTPEQVAVAIQRWVEAGVDSIVFQPLNGDVDCLDEYIRYLTPLQKLLG
jgi:alkanesulfonate monooxygenase SsuD/methylene tetrahydromethanopterin reductase-like flavin-dependent oxidoreductase (luciferase family)